MIIIRSVVQGESRAPIWPGWIHALAITHEKEINSQFRICNQTKLVIALYKAPIRHEENKLHAAGRLPMSSTHSMNARKCVHAQKPYPSQAVAHESSKVGGRGKREEERQERQRPGGWWKERQPNKTKHIWGTKTRPT